MNLTCRMEGRLARGDHPKSGRCPSSRLAGFRSLLALCMALWLPACVAAEPLEAASSELPDAPQPRAQAEALGQAQPQALEITILDGEGALNNIRQRTAREPIVQVKDRNRKPVAGALVLFAIHDGPSGAGASINGASSFSAITDAGGRAEARGFTPNGIEGQFTISVTATLGAAVATAIIHQQNRLGEASGTPEAPPAKPVHTGFHIIPKKTVTRELLVTGVVAAAMVVVVIIANESSASSITAGAGVVGHP